MQPYRRYFWITLAVLTGLRLIFIGLFELSPDEAYYWTWSRHLAWSYYDQGPMLALVIRFFTTLAGSATEWSVRLGAVFFSAATSWLFFVWIEKMHSARAAWLGFLSLQAALLFSAGSILMMHDSIMMFFWMAALLAFYRALNEDWTPGWFWGSLALGLGALSKYTMALFVPGLLLYLLLSPGQRHWWRKPHLYLAGLGTLALVSPIFFWNQAYGWASFGHVGQLGGVRPGLALSYKTLFDFLGGQLAVMTPLMAFWALAAPVIGWRLWRQVKTGAQAYLYAICFSAPILLFFIILSLRTSVYANWAAPAYPAALAILAGWVDQGLDSLRARTFRNWTLASLILAVLITLTAHAEVGWGILPLSGKAAHSVNRIRGWQALGQETGRRLAAMEQATGSTPFLAAQRYQIASVLAFYTPGQPEVQLFPVRFPATNQYRFWDKTAAWINRNALFVCEDAWETAGMEPWFALTRPLAPFQARVRNQLVREILYYEALGLQRPQRPSPHPGGQP